MLFALFLTLLCHLACSESGQSPLSDADKAGEVFEEGSTVKAALGNKKQKQNGKVKALYGKLAQIKFADANIGWVHVKEIEPQGAIQLFPEGDKCAYAKGDKVQAPWSTSRSMFAGTIDETHGKMAHIKYDDGDEDWADCDKLKPPKEDEPKAERSTSTGGGSGDASAAVTKCKRGCNKQCNGANNKSKCVNECRRRCDG